MITTMVGINVLSVDVVSEQVIWILSTLIDFSYLFIAVVGGSYKTLAEAQKAGAATLNYGTFISELINFLIMAFVVFMIVKFMNKLRRKEEPAPATTKICPHCKSEVHIGAKRKSYYNN